MVAQNSSLKEGFSVALRDVGDSSLSIVSSVSISPDGKLIAITDANAGNVAIYQVSNGVLVNFFQPGRGVVDSLVSSNVRGWSLGRYLTFAQVSTSFPQAISSMQNDFVQAEFINDSSLAILGDVRPLFVPSSPNGGPTSYIDHRMFIQLRDLNRRRLQYIYPEEIGPEATFARRGLLLVDRRTDGFILSVANDRRVSEGKAMNAPTMAIYDLHGNRTEELAFLPNEAVQSGLNYNLLQPVGAVDSAGNIMLCYTLGSEANVLPSRAAFSLTPIAGLNSNVYSLAEKLHSKWTPVIPFEKVAAQIQSYISSIDVASNGRFELSVRLGKPSHFHWEVLEYSAAGQLLRQATVPLPDSLGSVKSLTYQASLHGFTVVSLNAQNQYELTTFRWST